MFLSLSLHLTLSLKKKIKVLIYLLFLDDPYICNPEYYIVYIYSGVKFFILLPTCLIYNFIKYRMMEYLKKIYEVSV